LQEALPLPNDRGSAEGGEEEMLMSLYTSVSGMRSNLTALNVFGNNISNVNSIAFKGGRVTFRETLVQTLQGARRPDGTLGGSNPVQMGLGMGIGSVDSMLSQGVLQSTGLETDLGINGEGFFILSDGRRDYYTRAGAFTYDKEGNFVDPATSYIVQGRMANQDGEIAASAPIENIQLPFGIKVPARATSEITLGCNLDAAATTSTAALGDAGTTGINLVSGLASDGAGGTHTITVTGLNATNSTASGSNLLDPAGLDGTETLGALGVTDFSDFTLSVDGGTAVAVTGLTGTSTVQDLITAINSAAPGVTASLDSGEVVLTRVYAGDGALYNVTTSDGVDGNISRQIFGAAGGSAFVANNGTASTLVAEDVFTPVGRAALDAESVSLIADSITGLITGIGGIGGAGVEVTATDGLAEGTAVINTAETEHYTSVITYDSLGVGHNLSLRFSRSPVANEWYWDASLDGDEVIASGQSGTVTFFEDGSLNQFQFDNGATAIAFDPGTGAEAVQISFNAGTGGGFEGITQFASPFSTTARAQNGYEMGNLIDVAIDGTGIISGIFSNGMTRALAQISLAKFNNPGGLERAGNALFTESSNSGLAIKGDPGEVVFASLSSGTLEMSNVDLAEEFVDMIVAQRGLQASARVLTASDEMLAEVVNLTR
jgi:flagellar hook protein FlgE